MSKTLTQKEDNRIRAREYYNTKIKPITQKRMQKRYLDRLFLLLGNIKKCEVCGKIYLPHRYRYKPYQEKSRFCSRKCQHISQKIEFKGMGSGENNPFYGKKHTKESRLQISSSRIGMHSKEQHWNWRGGSSFQPYPLGWTKTFREQIRYRDKYVCQICGVPETECKRRLHVHHINYDKSNIKEDNLVSLCQSCHMKTNINRDKWIKYFCKSSVTQGGNK